ncbi:MAG: hypothetical protein R3F29_10110 [Planctomycetota bacterium]
MDWFERLVGVPEGMPDEVRAALVVDGEFLVSRHNGRRMRHGTLETPSLSELRVRAGALAPGRLRVRQVLADVQVLHVAPDAPGASFQVASQFNLLEMVGPHVTPEHGVARYEQDLTQGPACAIAAGAGTIFRNYFAPVGGGEGQSATRQIDCLVDLGAALGNERQLHWRMQNGYALPTADGYAAVERAIIDADEAQRDAWRALLRVGLQRDTEVTLDDAGHLVSQVFCSALPVAYAGGLRAEPQQFATLVLEAAYEATLLAARENAARGGSTRCYLTQLGGGAFGNRFAWIDAALRRALTMHRDAGLDVRIVSYGQPDPGIGRLVEAFA